VAGDIQREGQDLLNPQMSTTLKNMAKMAPLQLPPAFRPRVAPFQHQLATLKAPLFFPRG
jgi:hypothetical protein